MPRNARVDGTPVPKRAWAFGVSATNAGNEDGKRPRIKRIASALRGARVVAVGMTKPQWYAAYTCANRERRVAEQLGARKVQHFLPLYSSLRRWKDRRVLLKLPLFPGYVFVRMALQDRLQVQMVPGVARLVGFDGVPAALPDQEIEALRISLGNVVQAEPHPYLTEGRRVRVTRGPLTGLEGLLVRRKGNSRLVISIELIQRSVAVDADEADVEPLSHWQAVGKIGEIV